MERPPPSHRDEADAPLPFERWARLSGAMLGLDADGREALLELHGLDGSSWQPADSYWMSAIAADLGNGRLDRLETFGAMCARERRRRSLRGDVDSTADPVTCDGRPLPFDADSADAVRARLFDGRAGAARRVSPGPTTPGDADDETVLGGAAVEDPTLPFLRRPAALAAEASPGKLTLEEYASLAVEIAAKLEPLADVLERYGVEGSEAHRAIEQSFARAFDAEPALRRRFDAEVARLRGWLASHGLGDRR